MVRAAGDGDGQVLVVVGIAAPDGRERGILDPLGKAGERVEPGFPFVVVQGNVFPDPGILEALPHLLENRRRQEQPEAGARTEGLEDPAGLPSRRISALA